MNTMKLRRLALALVATVVACRETFSPANDAPDASVDADVDATEEAGHGDDHDTSNCHTIGRTGPADTCSLFGYCGHRDLELDCSARFTCVCSEKNIDGGATKQIAAQPIFCGSSASDMRAAFDVAHRACDW